MSDVLTRLSQEPPGKEARGIFLWGLLTENTLKDTVTNERYLDKYVTELRKGDWVFVSASDGFQRLGVVTVGNGRVVFSSLDWLKW